MCGIAGVVDLGARVAPDADALVATLRHRGPDSTGVFTRNSCHGSGPVRLSTGGALPTVTSALSLNAASEPSSEVSVTSNSPSSLQVTNVAGSSGSENWQFAPASVPDTGRALQRTEPSSDASA